MNDHADYCVRHMWNNLTQGPCTQCMNSEQKLAYVWAQMRNAMEDGEPIPMMCPYCMSVIQAGEKPCCPTMRNAIAAILEREDRMRLMTEAIRGN